MKKDLQTFMYQLRIHADVEVVEMVSKPSNCGNLENLLFFCSQKKMLAIRAGIPKLLARVANREDPGSTLFV